MKIRSRAARAERRERFKKGIPLLTFRGEKGKPLRIAALIAGGLLAVFLISRAMRPEPSLMSTVEIANIWDRGVLSIGVRDDVPGMAEDGAGLEAELAELLAQRIMSYDDSWTGDNLAADLVSVTSMTVGSKMYDGSIDAAAALLPAGANASYSYSRPYYIDPCRFLLPEGQGGREIKNLTVGYLQSASSSSLYVPSGASGDRLSAYIEAHPDDGIEKAGYASYTELFDALEKGKCDAIILNDLMIKKYGGGRAYSVSTTDPGSLSYAIASLASAPAVAGVADMMLAEMIEDGSLRALYEKYGLDYALE